VDQSSAPVLEALVAYRERGDISFTPPGHKQGRGIDDRGAAVLGRDVFAADVMAMNGLDDRLQNNGVLEKAQQLMADAVGADRAFFSTCGSSLSVKSAMIAVAGPPSRSSSSTATSTSRWWRASSSPVSSRCGSTHAEMPNCI
jgi:arginine decarboxylase